MRLRCPNCDKLLALPDSFAGKAGQCPGCKARFPIPAAKTKPKPVEDDVEDIEEEEEEPPRRAAKNDRIAAKRSPRDDARPARRPRDDDDDDRPSRRSRDDDDDDDRPSRRRSRADDSDDRLNVRRGRDDDDRPSRRSRDDDDDDRPSRPRRRRRRRRSSGGGGFTSPMAIAGYVGGGVVLLCCLVALIVPALAIVPVGLGYLLAFVGGIWFLIVAFQDDVMQGILCWFIPFYSFYYLVTHFEEEKYPFFTQVAGFILIFVGICAGGAGAGAQGL